MSPRLRVTLALLLAVLAWGVWRIATLLNQPDGTVTPPSVRGDLAHSSPSTGSSRRENWLKLHLTDCPGATSLSNLYILFRADGRQQVQPVTPDTQAGVSNLPVIHLHLGSVTEVEWVEVWWPDLHHTRLDWPEINRAHDVRREVPKETIPVERIEGGAGQRLPDGF